MKRPGKARHLRSAAPVLWPARHVNHRVVTEVLAPGESLTIGPDEEE